MCVSNLFRLNSFLFYRFFLYKNKININRQTMTMTPKMCRLVVVWLYWLVLSFLVLLCCLRWWILCARATYVGNHHMCMWVVLCVYVVNVNIWSMCLVWCVQDCDAFKTPVSSRLLKILWTSHGNPRTPLSRLEIQGSALYHHTHSILPIWLRFECNNPIRLFILSHSAQLES